MRMLWPSFTKQILHSKSGCDSDPAIVAVLQKQDRNGTCLDGLIIQEAPPWWEKPKVSEEPELLMLH